MSEIDDLEDWLAILTPSTGAPIGRPPQVACGSDQHLKPPNIRFYMDGRRRRHLCKLCESVRRREKAKRRKARPTYNMQDYPL